TGLPFLPLPASAVLRLRLALANADFGLFTDLDAVNALSSPVFTNAAPPAGGPGERTLVTGPTAPPGLFAEGESHLAGWGSRCGRRFRGVATTPPRAPARRRPPVGTVAKPVIAAALADQPSRPSARSAVSDPEVSRSSPLTDNRGTMPAYKTPGVFVEEISTL